VQMTTKVVIGHIAKADLPGGACRTGPSDRSQDLNLTVTGATVQPS